MEITLTKTQQYNLLPYGKFTIKWKTKQGHLPNIIPFDELQIKHDTTMPLTAEQDKLIIKFMKKHKTDILIDGRDFYTRAASGFTEVYHKKLGLYRDDTAFKNAVDTGDSFAMIMLNKI